jgi:hypothetical protein
MFFCPFCYPCYIASFVITVVACWLHQKATEMDIQLVYFDQLIFSVSVDLVYQEVADHQRLW